MIEYIFSRLLIMSFIGSVLFLLLHTLSRLTRRRFGAKWRYYSLVAAMLVFLVPLSAKLPQSEIVYSKAARSVTDTAQYSPIIIYEVPQKETGQALPMQAKDSFQKAPDFSPYARILGSIWLIGAAGFLTYSIVSYLLFKSRLKKQSYPFLADVECGRLKHIRKSPLIASPLLIGLFRPVLYLPDKALSQKDTENIIRHEQIHLSRFDLPVKWICLVAKSLHWFNPVVYILAGRISSECEISCDVEATKLLDRKGAEGYCETILSLITDTQESLSPSLGMGDTKKNLERRFRAIMEEKKQSRKIAIISSIAAGVLVLSALTASAIFGGKVEKKEKNENEDNIQSDLTQEDTDNDFETVVVYREASQDDEIAVLKLGDTYNQEDVKYELTPLEQAENSTVRVHPITGKEAYSQAEISHGFDSETHPAADYKLESGTVITSPFDGSVKTAEYTPDKGNHIQIEGLDGSTSVVFAHLEKMYVSKGDKVNAGDTVGTVGTTGRSTGPHLHVEYYENGEAVNPVEVFITEENGEILAVYSKPETILD